MSSQKGLVGIVVVCHNKKLSEEIINFCNVLKQSDFKIVNGGGTDTEIYGTNPDIVKNAIEQADSGNGVLIFVDMGSSIINSELAIEILDGKIDARIADAPVLEGIISAVAANSEGMTLEELENIAEDSKNFNKIG